VKDAVRAALGFLRAGFTEGPRTAPDGASVWRAKCQGVYLTGAARYVVLVNEVAGTVDVERREGTRMVVLRSRDVIFRWIQGQVQGPPLEFSEDMFLWEPPALPPGDFPKPAVQAALEPLLTMVHPTSSPETVIDTCVLLASLLKRHGHGALPDLRARLKDVLVAFIAARSRCLASEIATLLLTFASDSH